MNFSHIKTAVAAQFQRLQSRPDSSLYRVEVDRDALWSCYLSSFPPGTDPIYRQRTGHDCSCCRQFIRTVGDVVGVVDGKIVSIWDVEIHEEPAYQVVVNNLSALVHSCPIAGPFYHYEGVAGTDKSFEERTGEDGDKAGVVTWAHFHVNINRAYVKRETDIPTLLSEARSAHDVFLRSLEEITHDSIDTVLDLIAQNSLYRGEEHRGLVQQFQHAKRRFDTIDDLRMCTIFAYSASGAVTRMRNTAIGTLLVDLSEGRDIESAVASYESKVAPTNYKRPSSIVIPAMVQKAKETLSSLGLLSSLERRYATLRDLDVNNILFADRSARKTLTGDVFDELIDSAPATSTLKNLDKVEEVPISRFISDILPRIDTLALLFENRHTSNLVSLIAPIDPTSRPLFKWDNLFSWSYSGELADAIKERVKQAGGNVTGDLCCRLAWFNHDDLDLHMVEPHKYEIYYGTKHQMSPCGGRLDVDMNVAPTTREPVENIFYASKSRMREGTYHLFVHQFNSRESTNTGFECEVDFLGEVRRFTYDKPVRQGEKVMVARLRYTHKDGLSIIESLPSTQTSRVVWGLPTQVFHRVNVLTMSPNCWGESRGESEGAHTIGNRHYFFMLDGCRNDGSARGFFNEFLREDLNVHRKTMEVVASKMKLEAAIDSDQLSGVGFSSTRRDTVVCQVKGKGNFQRTIRVTF